jgi:hypothetical protein
MEQGIQKLAEALEQSGQPARPEPKRGPGRPKGSRSKNDDTSGEANDVPGSVAAEPGSLQHAVDDMRASVEVRLEQLLERVEKLDETIRVVGVSLGQGSGTQPQMAELLAEMKRLNAAEQTKGEQVDQWTRVMVELSGADRRRYWRIMRAVYRFARADKKRDAKRKATHAWGWWPFAAFALLAVVVFYVAIWIP